MSSIHKVINCCHSKEIKIITTPKNGSSNFFLVAAGTALVVILAVISFATAPISTVVSNQQSLIENKSDATLFPLSADAFPQYRQSEWHSSTAPVTGMNSSEIYHQSERMLILPQTGWITYHLSERTLVDHLAEYLASERTLSPIVNTDLSSYYLSERTLTEAASINALSEYFTSERTFVDPLAGLATYFNSERTRVPMRNLTSFNPYQISEWFGK